jgi:leucyl-tRNA synthetase
MVCKETQECPEHGLLYPHEVKDNLCIHCQSDVIIGNTVKMSKSIKNVVDPEELINHYGADTVRMFCLFTSPPERDLEWSEQGVEGSFRFLNRVWRLVGDHLKEFSGFSTYEGKEPLSGHLKNLHQKTHQTIKKVTDDIEDRFHFNTAISAVMELINEVNRFLKSDQDKAPLAWSLVKEAVEATVVLLFPVVPHITEELWSMLGHDETLINIPWPTYRVEALEVEKRLIVLQVNSKVRSRVEVPASYNQREIEAEALKNERVQQFVGEKPIKKVIVVKNKLVNIVV